MHDGMKSNIEVCSYDCWTNCECLDVVGMKCPLPWSNSIYFVLSESIPMRLCWKSRHFCPKETLYAVLVWLVLCIIQNKVSTGISSLKSIAFPSVA